MKKINLIEWLWKTDSHEKQSPQRFGRYAAMLIMLLTLGVGQMWAWSTARVAGSNFTNLNSWDPTDTRGTMTNTSGTIWSITLTGQNTNKKQFKITFDGSWNNAVGYKSVTCTGGAIDGNNNGNIDLTPNADGDITITYNSSDDAITITCTSPLGVTYYANTGSGTAPTDATTYSSGAIVTVEGKNTLSKSGYVFAGWNTAANGTGTHYDPGATFSITSATQLYAQWLDVTVLNGTKIMVYGGELISWGKSAYHFRSSQKTSSTIGTASKDIYPISINSEDYWFGPVVITSGTYYQGHPDWAPNLSCAISAGNAYLIRNGSPSSTYFERKAGNNNADALYRVKKAGDYTPKNSFSAFSIDASVTEGNSINVSSTPAAGSAGKSVIGRKNYVQYYLYDGSSWSLISLSAGEADVSDLSAGSGYKIAAVLSDGCIYVATSESFEVVAAASNYSLTFGVANSPYNNGTLGVTVGGAAASSGSSYASGSSIACSATPSAHYRVKGWYSDNSCTSAIGGAGTGNTYNFSLAANTVVYVGFETATTDITLNGNGGSNTSVTATHGNALPSFSASSRTGYTLNGYFTNSSGGTKIINANGSLVKNVSGYTTNDDTPKWDNKDRTMTLHAQWTAHTYSVAYNANDDQYPGTASGSMSNSAHTYGTAKSLTSNAYSRSGYTFAGWATTPTGSKAYDDGQSVSNLSATQGATVTLYAKWQAFDVHIKHPWDGGDWSWIQMEPQSDGTYTYTGFYGKNGVDLNTTESDSGKRWIQEDNIAGYGSVKKCQNVTFTYTPSALSENNGKDGTMSVAAATPVVKTIHVKKGDGWDNITHIYAWNDAVFGGWPGSAINSAQDCSISSYLSSDQWVTIVLPSYLKGCDGFVLSNGQSDNSSGPIKYQTTDLTYASLEDNACYVLDNKTEDSNGSYYPQKTYKFSLTKIANCPAAPTVSTNNISTMNLTSATLGGNITSDGNDVVTEYGYYYSLDSRLASGTVETYGTQVVVGTDDKDGRFSKSQTGLAVGTTYHVIAYAKNAFGTGWGAVKSFSTTSATLSLEGTANYTDKTMTITPTHNVNSTNGYSGDFVICCECTSKPGGAGAPTISWNNTTKKFEISGTTVAGDYTFNVKVKQGLSCSGDVFNDADEDITIIMKDFVDLSGLTINHAKYNGTYMNGNGTSGTPYFIYLTNASSYGKLNLTATLPAALLTGEGLYYSVNSLEIGAVTVDGTSASVTMDLPDKTVGADRTAAIKFYSKLDGQAAPSAKMASLTVYYTVNANPIVTVSGTYNGNPIAGEIPQNAEITVSASVTQIPGEPTFVYKKGSGEYSATTSYTIESAGTTTMYAKTSYLGEWTGTLAVTTYAANPVTLVTKKTDMYGDIAISSTSRVFRSSGEEFSAPDIDGYTFSSWSCTGDNVRVSDDEGENWVTSSTNQTVYVKATAAGSTLTANYTEVKRIYFDNTNTNWDTVHIILFTGSSPWRDSKGVIASPNNGYSGMTRIGQSDIYYYEYGATTIDYVAFTEHDQHNYNEGLYNTKAAFRGDFSECNPCYVAPADKNETKNGVDYFSDGYWRRYMPQYSPLSIYLVSGGLLTGDQGKFEPENKKIDSENFTKELLLAGSTTYYFNLPSSCGGAYGNNGIMTKDNCTNWTFEHTSGSIGNCRIETTAEGTYIFRLSTANGQVKLSVEYPLSEGDYRIAYTDATGNNDNYSNYIRQNTGESAKNDTVSFYVKTSTPKYQVQQCSGFDGDGKPEWDDVGDEVAISVSKDSVYYFVFQQPAGGASISQISQGVYSGNYYIRTDGVAGGWANYLSNPDNKMTHTDKASALATGYDYYKVKWIGDANGNSTTNVKFVIANDYNNSLSQEFGDDPAGGNINPGQALTGKGANVRFTWNASTNEMSRAYIGGSGHDANYLMIDGDNLKKSDDSDWAASAMSDQNDWIYTIELKAADDATIQIQSHYNNTYVTVLPKETVLIVSDANYYDLRIVYDYKTNEIVAAYIPSTVSTNLEVDVDIMFIRKAKDNHEDAPPTTLNLVNGAKITGDPKTLYGAIEFEKAYVRAEGDYAGLATRRPERSTYWISFPFNVRVKDIFGLGEYTDTWILQRYRGDRRAQIGWFLDTPTFWEYILDTDYVLEAGQGYVLSLDCEAIQWPNNRTTQYLYFPSKDKIEDITSVLPSASMNVPEHECTITSPADRTIKDSHWNVIGIPGFTEAWGKATETVSVCGGDFHYFYTWNPSTNTLSSASTTKYEFQFMHSYMVQYSGNIDWLASEPAGMPALQAPQAQPEEVEFRLAVLRGEEEADHTFITLMTKENITSSFDMNSDLVKMENANKTNIYTIINNDIQVAANCLPMSNQTTVVNVGVKVAGAGEYTFAMPDGTDGIGVTLIDNETGERTNLGLTDYTVNLNAGSINDRFVLEISPVSQTTTDIETVTEDGLQITGARKVMIDGILYIVRDGQVFDARGARVQ